MTIQFVELTEPTPGIVEAINRWENDPDLIPLTRPNRNQVDLERRYSLTLQELGKRLENHHSYLIYQDRQLVGEMNFMVDPAHLYKKEPKTAWIGITIGEPAGRGKGIGSKAIQHLEEQIKEHRLKRIELGVFEYNEQAIKLYTKMGYRTIGRIEEFTFWKGKMWADIRMEKYL